MKKIQKIREHLTGKSLKRKKVCKFTKADHEFEMVFPSWYQSWTEKFTTPYNSPEEYYAAERTRIVKNNPPSRGWLRDTLFVAYACKHCGKKDYKIEKPKEK